MKRVIQAIAALILTTSPAWACDPGRVAADISYCANLCNVSGHQEECAASNFMRENAQYLRSPQVLEGFNTCQKGGGERDNANSCHIGGTLAQIACGVYGNCPKPPAPIPPPVTPPVTKKIEFKQEMKVAKKNTPVADFVLTGEGRFKKITLNYTRNGVTVNNMTTTAVAYTAESAGLHLVITAFDSRALEEKDYRYVVFGEIEVLVP